MSTTARLLRVVGAAAVVVAAGLLAWVLLVRETVDTAAVGPTPVATGTAVPATAIPPVTAVPTATPQPTPTPAPTAVPFVEVVPGGDQNALLTTPLPDCGLLSDATVVAGAVTLRCIEDWASVPVVAAADGRVVHISTQPAVTIEPDTSVNAGIWNWAEYSQLGPHVVVDHGSLGDTANTQTVYAGLASIEEGVGIGTTVSQGDPLGSVDGPSASVRFSVWSNNARQDGAQVLAEAPAFETQLAVAEALRPALASPTDPRCPLVRSAGQLPGAPRAYRNGTHRGIDFGCGAADRSGHAVADGTVVYLVNDYSDPSVGDREALLQTAGFAGFTPHWTLVMLYGNVVVVDHGVIPGAGRVVTITAHLESVDPTIQLGGSVVRGQRLGELGNRGTNASALGIRGAADPSLHLHWELYIDNWYLGSGLDPLAISQLVTTALCGEAQTPGCPA